MSDPVGPVRPRDFKNVQKWQRGIRIEFPEDRRTICGWCRHEFVSTWNVPGMEIVCPDCGFFGFFLGRDL